MTPCFVEFAIASKEQLEKLEAVVAALCEAKRINLFQPDAYWLAFFDAEARASFWHPTETELKEWERRWFATPVEHRWHDQSLKIPWNFGSMIEAFENGEYKLLGCHRVAIQTARLEFNPNSSPYGGTGCMEALIKAFGHQVTAIAD